jgi:hypothetical protein
MALEDFRCITDEPEVEEKKHARYAALGEEQLYNELMYIIVALYKKQGVADFLDTMAGLVPSVMMSFVDPGKPVPMRALGYIAFADRWMKKTREAVSYFMEALIAGKSAKDLKDDEEKE